MAVVEGTNVWATGLLVASKGRHGLLLEHETRGLDQVPPALDAPWVVALTGSRPAPGALGGVVVIVGVRTGADVRAARATVLGHPRDRPAPGEAAATEGARDRGRDPIDDPAPATTARGRHQ